MPLGFPRRPPPEFPRHPPPHKSDQNQERQSYRLRLLGADLPTSVLEGGAREAGGPGPPRVIPRRDVVNQPQPHSVGSFAERHPANSPHGDFSQQIPKATKTSATRFCPEKGRILRTSESKCQFIRKKAGFSGQTLPHKAIIIRNNRATVARWLGADLPPSVLEGGAREAGGPGSPRVIPRRDVVNQPLPHSVGSFAERHPANSPHGDFSQQIPKATKTPATRFCPEKGGVLRTSKSKCQFIRKKAGLSGQTRGKVSRTDADCGLTDKLGLRFTDRRSLDFPDTCHLDFPDALHLNFPDTTYFTKQPKSGTTELLSQMARGGLTALGTRGRGPLSGRAWSAQSPSETGRGEPTTATPGRLFC